MSADPDNHLLPCLELHSSRPNPNLQPYYFAQRNFFLVGVIVRWPIWFGEDWVEGAMACSQDTLRPNLLQRRDQRHIGLGLDAAIYSIQVGNRDVDVS
jgi:hypothetical protein